MSRLLAFFKPYFRPGMERRRALMTVFGVLTGGLSVGLFKESNFGVDPFQCLCAGLDLKIPIDFGTLYLIINAVLLLVVFVLDRHYISLGTFINLFLLGYVVQFSQNTLHAVFGDPSMALRIAYLVVGMVVLCLASSLYFTADLGVSTYDAIALFLASKKIAPFRFIRIFTDLCCVGIGWVLGCVPGVGTLLSAFFMGPLISWFNKTVAQPMLHQGLDA